MGFNKWTGLALFAAMAALFLIANRGASRGFFQADELDSISWTPHTALAVFAADLASPVYNARNFRPVGHFYFRVMSRAFGLDFSRYLPPLHLVHLLNVWLLWLVLRRLGASHYAASAGALFFAFHMAVFDVYWKPMYAFDLFCATFCLLSMLAWIERRWVLSFGAFWLAYKSKEPAVMLPAVLACYELWLGSRRWRPLVPFFLVSISFGLQGILRNPNHGNQYAFHFTLAALAASTSFYARALVVAPLLPMLVLVWRDRRAWLGLATAALFCAPLLLLPGRLFSAYCYLPLTGVAMVFAALASMRHGFLAAVFLAAWLPWNYLALRHYRVDKLARDADTRAYVAQLQNAAPSLARIPVFIYRGLPPGLPQWGANSVLHYLLGDHGAALYASDDPSAEALLQCPAVATLTWDERCRKLWIAARTPETPDATYLTMNERTPPWQLTGGWYGLENGYRWTAPEASARLYRAPRATTFELVLNVGAQLLGAKGHADCSVRLNGAPLGKARVTEPGIRILRWPLPPGPPGTVEAELQAGPLRAPGADSRTLGLAVISFGFLPSGR
ncbi:MAG TPA: hypothetical protein VMT86_18685 [Bryobacteraceae bacterium]|nr:hypothetical protein [Bryobacteraceae bacterium]